MLTNALTAVLAQVTAPLVLPKLTNLKKQKITDSVSESVIFFEAPRSAPDGKRKILKFFEKYVLLLRIVV